MSSAERMVGPCQYRGRPFSGRSWFSRILAALCIAVSVVILWPLTAAVLRLFFPSGSIDLSGFERAFTAPGFVGVVANTAVAVLGATTLALLLGCTFAWLNERTDASLGWVSRLLPMTPFLLPPVAGAIGWIFLAAPSAGLLNVVIRGLAGVVGIETADRGPLNVHSWYGLIFVYTLYLIPQVYLVVSAALRNLDPALEEAARLSGSSPLRVVRRVTFPAVKQAIAGGAFLSILYGLGLFSVPIIIGSSANIEVIAVRIVRILTFSFPPRMDEALALSAVLVVFVGLAWLIQRSMTNRERHAMITANATTSEVRLGIWKRPARAVILIYIAATSVLPFSALVLVSLQQFWSAEVSWGRLSFTNYRDLFADETARAALMNSVGLGVTVATGGMLLALLVSVYVNQHRGVISQLVDSSTKLPGAVSNMVIAVAILATLAGPPFNLHGTLVILAIAYLILYMPQSTVVARSTISQIGNDLAEAARMSGSPPGKAFRHVTLPLSVPGLAVGWVFLFVLASGDITASSILAGARNPVIGFVVLDKFTGSTYPPLAALATVIGLLALITVGSVLVLAQRRRSARQR